MSVIVFVCGQHCFIRVELPFDAEIWQKINEETAEHRDGHNGDVAFDFDLSWAPQCAIHCLDYLAESISLQPHRVNKQGNRKCLDEFANCPFKIFVDFAKNKGIVEESA